MFFDNCPDQHSIIDHELSPQDIHFSVGKDVPSCLLARSFIA